MMTQRGSAHGSSSKSHVQATNAPRALYNELLSVYPKKNYPNRIITDSYLRLEQSIQGTVSTVSFNMLTNQGTGQQAQNVTENRLQITDRFVAASVAILIMKAGSSTSASQSEISVAKPHTFPNGYVFTGANEAENLQALYNSQMRITVDSTVYIQSLDVQRFYRVPTSQQNVAVSTAGSGNLINSDGWDSSSYPFSALTPTITFSGIGKNEIVITLPNSTNLGGTSSQNFAICWIRGYLIQNVNQGR